MDANLTLTYSDWVTLCQHFSEKKQQNKTFCVKPVSQNNDKHLPPALANLSLSLNLWSKKFWNVLQLEDCFIIVELRVLKHTNMNYKVLKQIYDYAFLNFLDHRFIFTDTHFSVYYFGFII